MAGKGPDLRKDLKQKNMESIGERLKKIRLEKGISLEEVQKKTKIHLSILKAIEGDSLTNLSPVYLKGFLKIYCKFLKVEPPQQPPAANVIPPEGVSAKPGAPTAFFKTPKLRLPSLGGIDKKVKRIFVFILVTIILSAALYNLGKFISSKRRSHKRLPKATAAPLTSKISVVKSKPVKKAETPKQASPAKETITKTPIKKEDASGIRLGIRTAENCWVSLKVDGRLVFHRVLEKGRFESWQAKERIELSVGNAGAIELEVNGQLFSNLGRRGQVRKNIVITKEGLNITR